MTWIARPHSVTTPSVVFKWITNLTRKSVDVGVKTKISTKEKLIDEEPLAEYTDKHTTHTTIDQHLNLLTTDLDCDRRSREEAN